MFCNVHFFVTDPSDLDIGARSPAAGVDSESRAVTFMFGIVYPFTVTTEVRLALEATGQTKRTLEQASGNG